MNYWKASTAVLFFLLLIAGYLLITAKTTTCSMTVVTNSSCNGSVVTVNSTANATPGTPFDPIVSQAGTELGGIKDQIINPPIGSPVPEFPGVAVPIAIIIGLAGIVAYIKWWHKT